MAKKNRSDGYSRATHVAALRSVSEELTKLAEVLSADAEALEKAKVPTAAEGTSFTEWLRTAMRAVGMSLKDLAKATDLSEGVLNSYLTTPDRAKNPSYANVLRICKALEVSVEAPQFCRDWGLE
ncbi:helix-turn-helix domain-containing protein [Limnoglobus roseus]|uniref:HTH cro/C1-type domain-containing protein n=1 Tax=Limnoglobus roseus TaxID=2598579 RepID=A0A5C1ASH4_9BACT|nr:helix-turn-helix transcriptional regulator [Limnoglobus roseus]QEL21107.1 hypothetical protein PX52LOC_08237 [Limnoglobus roseus]